MKAMDFNAWLFGQFQTFQKFAVVTVFHLREDPLYRYEMSSDLRGPWEPHCTEVYDPQLEWEKLREEKAQERTGKCGCCCS